MKPYVLGKSIFLREVQLSDAPFILRLRTDPDLNKHISSTDADVASQRHYIGSYQNSLAEYYFVIVDLKLRPIGTVRIYDIQGDSFCWGSWILSKDAPINAAIESALLIYDFAFFALHFRSSHFDVRKANIRVVDFHKRFGANVVREDDLNFYFEYDRDIYMQVRQKYSKFLP